MPLPFSPTIKVSVHRLRVRIMLNLHKDVLTFTLSWRASIGGRWTSLGGRNLTNWRERAQRKLFHPYLSLSHILNVQLLDVTLYLVLKNRWSLSFTNKWTYTPGCTKDSNDSVCACIFAGAAQAYHMGKKMTVFPSLSSLLAMILRILGVLPCKMLVQLC